MFNDPQKKIEGRRKGVLSAIRAEKLRFETMAQRARIVGETPSETVLTGVYERLNEFEQAANKAISIDDFDDLIDDAEVQGQLRAYICPRAEIQDEGTYTGFFGCSYAFRI
jgi:hypothetical protein